MHSIIIVILKTLMTYYVSSWNKTPLTQFSSKVQNVLQITCCDVTHINHQNIDWD